MTTGGVQCLGLCRFSYPSEPGAFAGHLSDLESLRAHLYDDARLALRFFWLEQVALPSLRRQDDPDFTLVLLAGDRLPAPHRDRLEALVRGMPQVRLVFAPEGQPHARVCREAMLAHRDPAARVVAEFRLDDDDALAGSFVAATRRHFAPLGPLFDAGGRVALDFCRGLVLEAGETGMTLRPVMAQLWTPGLVTFRRPDDPRSLLDANHLRLWTLMPVLSLRFPVMFLRGQHGDNASSVGSRPGRQPGFAATPAQLRRHMSAGFGLDLGRLDAAWAALREAALPER